MGRKSRSRRAAGQAAGRKINPDTRPDDGVRDAQAAKPEDSPAAAADNAGAVRALKSMPPSEVPGFFVWTLSAFIVMAAIVSPYGQTALGYHPDFHVSSYYQVGSVFLLLVYFLLQMKKRGNCALLIQRTPLILPVCVFFAWMLVSLLWATSLYEGLVKVLDWGAAVLMFLLIAMTMRDAKPFQVLCLCVFLSGVAISYLGISQYLFGVQWVHQHAAPAATFGNKNMAAQYMVATIPFGLALFFNERTPSKYWLYAAGLAMMFSFLYYTHTRASWLAFSGQLLLVALSLAFFKFKHGYKFGWDRHKMAAFATLLVAIVAMFNLTPNTFSGGEMGIDKAVNPTGANVETKSFSESIKSVSKGFSGSAGQRFGMWANTIPMMKDHLLLGTGIGNWMVHYPKYQAVVHPDSMLIAGFFHINTHNDYLEFASELGLVGMAVMLWIAAALLLVLWRLYLAPNMNGETRMLMLATAISAIGISTTAVFSFAMQQATTLTLFVVYLGAVSAVYWQTAGHAKGPYRLGFPAAPVRMATAVVLLSAFLVISGMHSQLFEAEMSYRRAVSSMRSGRIADFGKYAKLAVAQNPLRKYASYYLGNYYMGRKEYTHAIRHYERVLEDYPWRVELMKSLAIAYLQEKQPAKTKQILELWEEIQPHSFDAKVTLGTFYYQIGRKEQSREMLQRASRMQPGNTDVARMLESVEREINQPPSKDGAAAKAGAGGENPAASVH